MGHPTPRFPTTDDALKLFFPGQTISLKPFDDRPPVNYTVCKLSTPVTKSVVVLAKPDVGGPEQVVIKLFDPRYVDERIAVTPHGRSYPWNLATEQAAAMKRTKEPVLNYEELRDMMYRDRPEDPSGEDLVTHCLLWEEYFYRFMMEAHKSELAAYGRLKDLQGSAIPHLITAGQFLPLDERAIQPPAIVLEYVPSVNLNDIPFDMVTPALCTQIVSAVESFTLHGVVHNDLTVTNIRLTPPGKPVKGLVIDFGLASIRCEEDDEEEWTSLGASEVRWVKRLLEEERLRKPDYEGRLSRFR